LRGQGRYRVLVGLAGNRAAVVEFRPCIPAEGSDCGARVDRVIDLVKDSSVRAPAKNDRVRADDREVAIVGGTLVVVPSGNDGKRAHRLRRDANFTAGALALSGDAKYVFVTFESGTAAVPSEIRMIDLSTGTSIAHAVLPATPGGVSMFP
jgi:hypothetical protein